MPTTRSSSGDTAATYVGAVDQGTTSTRFVLFDEAGQPVTQAHRDHDQYYPRPGWVEHDPEQLARNTRRVIGAALAEAGVSSDSVAAIGVANQRETTVIWERATGRPLAPAIVWQDRRTAERIESLSETTTDRLRARTGLEPDAYFSASKLEWLFDNAASRPAEAREPGIEPTDVTAARGDDPAHPETPLRRRARAGEIAVGTVESWLIREMTGSHVTDATNASRTMLYDIHDERYDERALELFGVPRPALPPVKPSVPAAPYGRTDPDGFVGSAVPVAAALGDQQAALFGQTCFTAGETKATYGTGTFVLLHTGTEPARSDHGLVTTVAASVAGEPTTYALEGSVFTTGAAVEWLDEVGIVSEPAATAELAASVDSTDGVVVVPAYSGLGAPYWDGRARGTICGLTQGTTSAHLARATLEAIAYRTRDVADAMARDAGRAVTALRVDGGAAANDTLCRILAGVLDTPVRRAAVTETTALGAAFAAGLAVGYWPDRDALRDCWRGDRSFDPTGDDWERRYERWGEAVERSRDWARDD